MSGEPDHSAAPVAEERHLEVARTARYSVLGGDVARPAEVWFVLHGYGQLARRFIRRFGAVADGTRLVVAPEALSRFYVSSERGRHGPASVVGGTWMTREDREREIADYVAYLDRLAGTVLGGLDPVPPLTVLGFSQGAATASRWVTYGAVRPARLLLWGDYLPPDLDMERAAWALERAQLILVRGTRDRSLDAELESHEATRLAAVGIVPRRLTYEGGHDVDAGALASLLGA